VYSPHLNPIEPCFALVKQWIQSNEMERIADPVYNINLEFHQFAIGGPQTHSVVGLFDLYRLNHDAYLADLMDV
jgi:hypothetical protein